MRSAELTQQATAILERLEREMRARGYHFGWHQANCLIVSQTRHQARAARQAFDQLLLESACGFSASKSEIKSLPNGYFALEFLLERRGGSRKRRRRGKEPSHRTNGCVLRK